MSTTNRNVRLSVIGRASIALAGAAIAATTFGSASASAATVRHQPSNATTIKQEILRVPIPGQRQAEVVAFPAGGKGSASEKTCRRYTKAINLAHNTAVKQWWNRQGDAAFASQAAADALTAGAVDAGCAVLDAPA